MYSQFLHNTPAVREKPRLDRGNKNPAIACEMALFYHTNRLKVNSGPNIWDYSYVYINTYLWFCYLASNKIQFRYKV